MAAQAVTACTERDIQAAVALVEKDLQATTDMLHMDVQVRGTSTLQIFPRPPAKVEGEDGK